MCTYTVKYFLQILTDIWQCEYLSKLPSNIWWTYQMSLTTCLNFLLIYDGSIKCLWQRVKTAKFVFGTGAPVMFAVNLKEIFDTMGATSGAATAYPSRAPEFIPSFWWSSCCTIFCFLCNASQIVVCPFSFGHCLVRPCPIYGFWLPLWYL
jgi:hypothetical protein